MNGLYLLYLSILYLRYSPTLVKVFTYSARGLLKVFSEEFGAGREHELVRGELVLALHGDRDVGIGAYLRREKGEMRNEWR